MSIYRIAIDLTTKTIEKRAKYFRNLIVGVVLVSLVAFGWALVSRKLFPLSLLLLLLPLCGLFYFLDAKLLAEWRGRLFSSWITGQIDFGALNAAVRAVPTLPKDTLGRMLDALPPTGDLLAEHQVPSPTREAVAAVVMTIHACRSDAVAFKTAGYAIAGVLLIVTLAMQIWQPLSGVIAIAFFPHLQRRVRQWRLGHLKQRIHAAKNHPDCNLEKLNEMVTALNWEPISPLGKNDCLFSR